MNKFDHGFYNSEELREMGFKKVGKNVMIEKNCTIIGIENISIGDNVRIDGYSSIIANNGYCSIGSYIHIAAYSFLSAVYGIELHDFSGLSQGVRIYSATDDYSGNSMTNPMVPEKYKKVKTGKVILNKHVIIGSGSVILPGVEIGIGSSVGALSLVTKSLDEWGLYAGNPVKRIKDKPKKILESEAEFLNEIKNNNIN